MWNSQIRQIFQEDKKIYRIIIALLLWLYIALNTWTYFSEHHVSLFLGRTRTIHYQANAAVAILTCYWIFGLAVSWFALKDRPKLQH